MKQYQLKEVKKVVTTETKPTTKLKVGLPAQTGTRAGFLSGGAGNFPGSRTLLKAN